MKFTRRQKVTTFHACELASCTSIATLRWGWGAYEGPKKIDRTIYLLQTDTEEDNVHDQRNHEH